VGIEPYFFQSWGHDEHIDTNSREDRMRHSPDRGDTNNYDRESETDMVKEIDLDLANIVPTHTHSDRESDDTHHR
jgi:hypothetical protein